MYTMDMKPVKSDTCLSCSIVPVKIHTVLFLFLWLYYAKYVLAYSTHVNEDHSLPFEMFAVLKIPQETGQRQRKGIWSKAKW